MDKFLTVSEVARKLGVPPRKISDLLYLRKLDDARCPVVGRQRLIPVDYVATIQRVLQERQKKELVHA